jgi:hypothetical protein
VQKSTITEVKNAIVSFSSRLDQREERSKPKTEHLKSCSQRQKENWKGNEERLRGL